MSEEAIKYHRRIGWYKKCEIYKHTLPHTLYSVGGRLIKPGHHFPALHTLAQAHKWIDGQDKLRGEA